MRMTSRLQYELEFYMLHGQCRKCTLMVNLLDIGTAVSDDFGHARQDARDILGFHQNPR